MLKGIRVKTKDELVQRIYKYFDEVSEEPVVYHWKYRLDEIDPSEKVVVDTLPIKKVELITDGYTRERYIPCSLSLLLSRIHPVHETP